MKPYGKDRLAIRAPKKTVSIRIRQSQVTLKIRTPVPQCKPLEPRVAPSQ